MTNINDLGKENPIKRKHEYKYTYSSNISIDELEQIIRIMKERKVEVVGLHFKNDSILNSKHISDTGDSWDDIDSHIDVTAYDRA